MYIRAYKIPNKKTATEYITHRLVESYLTENGPRQRIIMHLGSLDLPKNQWRHLASILEARLAGQYSLTEDNQELSHLADQLIKQHEFVANRQQEKQERQKKANIVAVDLNSVQTSGNRSLGPELVANTFWKRLGFEQILVDLDLDQKAIALAQVAILGRLLEPGSEKNTWEWFQNRSSLSEFMVTDIRNIGKNPFYIIGDLLYEHKLVIEKALQAKEEELYSLTRAVVLFDLTNTYFEGSALGNCLAKRGKCKSNRTDCPLVTLTLAVDSMGFPLFSQTYGGSQSEPETLETVLKRLFPNGTPLFTEYLPTIIMDRGIATKDNIALIKDKYGLPYTVIERRAVEKEYIAEFEAVRSTFEKITAPKDEKQKSDTEAIYVKKIALEETSRILVFSEGRKQKETVMDALKEKRFLEELNKLNKSVKKGSIRQKEKVAERVGKIKAKYLTVQRYYAVDIPCDKSQQAIEISFVKNETHDERAVLTGCYVIETTHTELTASETWRQYMLLSHVEAAFRDMKSDLGIRPVYHQKAERTQAHLFIAVLAYHILVSIEHELRLQGDHREWRTIRKLLSSHNRSTVIMTGQDETIYHIRISGTPETEQARIYKMLSIKDPLKRSVVTKGSRK